MKLKLSALFVLCYMLASNIYSQDTENINSEKSMFLSEAYMSFGVQRSDLFNNFESNYVELTPYDRLISNEDMKFSDLKEYKYSHNSFFHLAVGIGFRDKDNPGTNKNVTLRVGLSYVNSKGFDGYWENEEVFAYDTLISNNSGETFIMDSTMRDQLYYEYVYEQLRLDMSLLFRSNTNRRFSVFGGVGVSTGVSINPATIISFVGNSTISERVVKPTDPYKRSLNLKSDDFSLLKGDRIENETNYNTAIYIPVGIDFRIANNHHFWKLVHIYYEMRPSMNYLFIPELGGMTSVLFSNNLGMRIRFT